jgi:O-antigen ligase
MLPLSSSAPFFDTRPNLYRAAHTVDLEVFASAPITGVGLETFAKAWPMHDDGARFAANFAGSQEHLVGVPLDTHSTWLGYLAEAGVFGGLVLVALVVLALRSRRGGRPELDAALVFAAATGVFVDVLTNRELAVVIGVLVGSRAAVRASIRETPRVIEGRTPPT